MIFGGICAGGTGSRMGGTLSGLPKQFLEIEGKPVISYSVETMLKWEKISKIIVAVNAEYIDLCKSLLPHDRVEITQAGRDRGDTVEAIAKRALELGGSEDILITHDAARPFVELETVKATVEAAEKYGVSGAFVPASDTVLQIRDGLVAAAPDRSEMYLAQTPQCFKLGLFFKVWNGLSEDEKAAVTDACGMFFRGGATVKAVEGTRSCFKITYKEDLERAGDYLKGSL